MDFGKTDRTLATGTIWYPSAGSRDIIDGSLGNVGNFGLCWSCTPSDYNAYCLGFRNDGNIGQSYIVNRAYGRSVRCIKE